jgi:hypothetical protein
VRPRAPSAESRVALLLVDVITDLEFVTGDKL